MAKTRPLAVPAARGMWQTFDDVFQGAKYIDLTHAFEPVQPVWPGFGQCGSRRARPAGDPGDYAAKGENSPTRSTASS